MTARILKNHYMGYAQGKYHRRISKNSSDYIIRFLKMTSINADIEIESDIQAINF